MKDSQRQTIQEVLYAAKVHRKALDGAGLRKGHAADLIDVKEGMDISISKLECLLEEDKPRRKSKGQK